MRFLRREAMTGALGVLSALAISHGSATAQTPLAIERDPPIATQPVAPAPILVPQAQGVPIPAAPPVAAKPLVVPPGPAPVAVPPPIAPDPVFTPKAPQPTASSSPVAPPTTPAEKPATPETPPAPAPTAAPEAAPSAPAPATTPAPAETAPAPTAPAAPAEAPAVPAPTPAVPPAPPPATPPATPPAPPAAAPAPVPAVPAPVAPGPAEPAPVAPRASTGPAVEDVTVAPRTVLFITGVTTWERAEEQMGEVFGRLAKAAAKLGVKDPGGPLVEYIESDTDDVGFRAMLPIGSTPKGKLPKGIKLGQSPSGHALKFRHDGPIDDLEEVYGRIDDEVTKRGVDARSIVEEYDGDALASPEDRVVVDVWVFLK